jgi:hypothetical protein
VFENFSGKHLHLYTNGGIFFYYNFNQYILALLTCWQFLLAATALGMINQGKQVYTNFDATTCTVGGAPFLFL